MVETVWIPAASRMGHAASWTVACTTDTAAPKDTNPGTVWLSGQTPQLKIAPELAKKTTTNLCTGIEWGQSAGLDNHHDHGPPIAYVLLQIKFGELLQTKCKREES